MSEQCQSSVGASVSVAHRCRTECRVVSGGVGSGVGQCRGFLTVDLKCVHMLHMHTCGCAYSNNSLLRYEPSSLLYSLLLHSSTRAAAAPRAGSSNDAGGPARGRRHAGRHRDAALGVLPLWLHSRHQLRRVPAPAHRHATGARCRPARARRLATQRHARGIAAERHAARRVVGLRRPELQLSAERQPPQPESESRLRRWAAAQ